MPTDVFTEGPGMVAGLTYDAATDRVLSLFLITEGPDQYWAEVSDPETGQKWGVTGPGVDDAGNPTDTQVAMVGGPENPVYRAALTKSGGSGSPPDPEA